MRRPSLSPHRIAALLAIVLAVAVWLPARLAHASVPATVTVNVGQVIAPVPEDGLGMNTGVWDAHLQDSSMPSLVGSIGTRVLRYPGGSTSDAYHWQTNSITPGQGGYANPNNTFDTFMTNLAKPSGSNVMVTVNYGSNASGTSGGDPHEAAAWVDYANNVKGYGVKYWEIGNEIYGNHYYGGNWETDLHADQSPTAYATSAVLFSQTMKAKDPSIKVGLVLTTPGDWFDSLGPQKWTPTVLAKACSAADFVVVHWYPQEPGSESDAGLLTKPASIPGIVSTLRGELNQYCGAHASQVGIMVTETNSVSSNPGKQTVGVINGLFLIDTYSAWLKAGVDNVDWWMIHGGANTSGNNSSTLAGNAAYGDYGVLSSGDGGEPAANTAFPSYTALQLLSGAIRPGGRFVSASSSAPALHIHAVREADGSLALLLVNTSSTDSYSISPSFGGFTPASGTSTTFSLASPQSSTATLSVRDGQFSYTSAPDSATLLKLSNAPAPVPTPSPTGGTIKLITPVALQVLANFEGTTDGFTGNSDVSSMGPSTWADTIALGSSSLWVQYSIPSAWSEAQESLWLDTDMRRFNALSVSVYPKAPAVSGAGVKVRFLVQGSDNAWYASTYQGVPTGQRSTLTYSIAGVPRQNQKMDILCWQYTTAATGTGNEIWFDNLSATTWQPGTAAAALHAALHLAR